MKQKQKQQQNEIDQRKKMLKMQFCLAHNFGSFQTIDEFGRDHVTHAKENKKKEDEN